jgi:hypothetical protein
MQQIHALPMTRGGREILKAQNGLDQAPRGESIKLGSAKL